MSLIPNDWSVAGGTWDSEITRVTSPAWAGGSSIQFDCPGSLADLQMVCGKFPVYPGQPIRVSSWFRADSTAADDWTYNGIDWLNAAEAVFQEDINYANAAAANTWQELAHVFIAPAGAAWAQLLFGQVSDDPSSQFVSNVGTCEATPLPRCAKVYRAADQTLGASPARVNFDATSYDYGGFWDGTNQYFVAPASMVARVTVSIAMNTSGTWTVAQPFLALNALSIPGPGYASFGGNVLQASWDLVLARGDTLYPKVVYGGTGTWTAYGSNTTAVISTFFTITEVKA